MTRTLIIATILLTWTFSVFGQSKNVENTLNGIADSEYFVCEEIGWKLEVPLGWSKLSVEDAKSRNTQLVKSIEAEIGTEIGQDENKCQIVLQRDKSNSAKSSVEKLEIEDSSELEIIQDFTKRLLVQVYQKAGFRIEVSETRKEIVDGIELNQFTIAVYSSDETIKLRQLVYTGYVNGYDYSLVISYTREEFRDEFLRKFKVSKFQKQ